MISKPNCQLPIFKKINQNINNIDNYFRRDNVLKIDEVDYQKINIFIVKYTLCINNV